MKASKHKIANSPIFAKAANLGPYLGFWILRAEMVDAGEKVQQIRRSKTELPSGYQGRKTWFNE